MNPAQPIITRTHAWLSIGYGTLVFLIWGFFAVTVLILGVNPLVSALCVAAAFGIGLTLVIGGALFLEANRAGEVWWMISGVCAIPAGLSRDLFTTALLGPAVAAGVIAAVQRFGSR